MDDYESALGVVNDALAALRKIALNTEDIGTKLALLRIEGLIEEYIILYPPFEEHS